MKYIPCSGLAGVNLVKPSTIDTFTKWYSGPTLLDVIGIYNLIFVNCFIKLSVNGVAVITSPRTGDYLRSG